MIMTVHVTAGFLLSCSAPVLEYSVLVENMDIIQTIMAF